MGNVDVSKILPPAKDAEGFELTAEKETAILDDLKVLPFEYWKDEKLVANYAIVVDPKLIKAGAFLDYQRAIARLAKEADERKAQHEEVEATQPAKEVSTEGSKAPARTRKKKGVEPAADELQFTPEEILIIADFSDLMLQRNHALATFLAPAVVAWNVRDMAPDIDTLTARIGPGPAALEVLGNWFFPTSPPSEEATGATEKANTAS